MAESAGTSGAGDMADWKLDDLETVNLAGLGAFSTVHEVVHPSTGEKIYAMKAISKEKIVTKKNMEHLFQEKEALSTLKNPFIVKFHRTFQDDNAFYFLMEHVPNGDLGEIMLRVKKFPAEQARYYASSALLAIEYLHKEGYIYRDLKLRNLTIDSTGRPKLIDFGFIKKLPLGERTSTFCGTPSILAPEELTGEDELNYGHEVDWWAMGIIIYEMLNGRTPFLDENREVMYENIKNSEPKFDGDWDEDARDLITKLLQKDPSKRLGKKGTDEVKSHPWFSKGSSTWWKDVEERKIDTSSFSLGKTEFNFAEAAGGEDPFADF